MADINFGEMAVSPVPTARERQVQRTQAMLYATLAGSVIIVVVAALFLTLF